LADARQQFARAIKLYQQALKRFQEAGDHGQIMRTYNLLGVVEHELGRLAEARAWYEKSREVAQQLNHQRGLGDAAQNIGIAHQREGVAARERGDESAAQRHLETARRSVEESRRIFQALEDKPREAGALGQLAQIHLLLGDLAAAERHAHESRQIHESLGLKEAWKNYDTLAEIAQARGDGAAATAWAQKRDALLQEIERRAGGGGGIRADMLKALQALAVACAQAGFGDSALGAAEEEGLAQLEQAPAPFPALAGFLRQIAAGQLPPIPAGLPDELQKWLQSLVESLRQGHS
jgi:tetratricopeptide (TPR) repeat protein